MVHRRYQPLRLRRADPAEHGGARRRRPQAGALRRLVFSVSIFVSYYLMGIGLYPAVEAAGIWRAIYIVVAVLAVLHGARGQPVLAAVLLGSLHRHPGAIGADGEAVQRDAVAAAVQSGVHPADDRLAVAELRIESHAVNIWAGWSMRRQLQRSTPLRDTQSIVVGAQHCIYVMFASSVRICVSRGM
jgi:hypothetical protein